MDFEALVEADFWVIIKYETLKPHLHQYPDLLFTPLMGSSIVNVVD